MTIIEVVHIVRGLQMYLEVMENVAEEAVAGSVLVFEEGTCIFAKGSNVFWRKLFFLHRCHATKCPIICK